jgi:hypothetical protein
VDLDHSVIKIRRTVSTARVNGGDLSQERHRWFDPKTKKGTRSILIPADLVSTLRAWCEKCPKSRLDLVFAIPFGEPANRTGIGRHGLKPALEQAKIEKNITMHGLRHTYASMFDSTRPKNHRGIQVSRSRRRFDHYESLRPFPRNRTPGAISKGGFRTVEIRFMQVLGLLAVFWLFLGPRVCFAKAARKVPVAVSHQGEDQVGRSVARAVAEAVRTSQRFTLVVTNAPRPKMIINLQSAEALAAPLHGQVSAIAISIIYYRKNIPGVGVLLRQAVNSCSPEIIESCAKSIFPYLEQATDFLKRHDPALWNTL